MTRAIQIMALNVQNTNFHNHSVMLFIAATFFSFFFYWRYTCLYILLIPNAYMWIGAPKRVESQ